ncbi:MAG: hypothetical protein GTO51_10365 [Candidatus Latescibacteria bacterium]|nr:hypothetical protein [Candidatus Latescibacterota bacterium]NIM66371.1 hypothetical protein [Candidatus Latescibacterota bacterium]NIO02850.1 hypothetical protein [Candidatus Latescibacterota bacterium]NIO29985.1 hypothetical protein [Candidatus Latescibacterota bacterium]NIO57600.1 hypothetical protein [Candidatus Latescibacterota bacterium]
MSTYRYKILSLILLLACGTASAQTDYSLRIRSLSEHLAGLVDDPLTDVFLNPARLGAFERFELYGTRLPGKSIEFPFRIPSSAYFHDELQESYSLSTGYEPIVLSSFIPGNERALSIGVEVDWEGYDQADRQFRYRPETDPVDGIERSSYAWERASDTKHVLLDLSGATFGKAHYGFRVTASHDSYQRTELNTDISALVEIGPQLNVSSNVAAIIYFPEAERTNIQAALGMVRPEKRITDIVVGGGLCRQLISVLAVASHVSDNDADRNGIGYGGEPVRYYYREYRYDSNRDYLGYRLFSRVHWQIMKGLRATHFASWERLEGDGQAAYTFDKKQYLAGNFSEITGERLSYSYDGTVSWLHANTSFGYMEKIHENFHVIFGIRGVYAWRRFEEGNGGDASLFLFEYQSGGSPDSVSLASVYMQKHDAVREVYKLFLPVACEWKVHKFVTLRAGIVFVATRDDNKVNTHRSLEAVDIESLFPGATFEMDYDITHETFAHFNNGIEVNISEKLILDLLATTYYKSSIHLADYAYLSVRYRF